MEEGKENKPEKVLKMSGPPLPSARIVMPAKSGDIRSALEISDRDGQK